MSPALVPLLSRSVGDRNGTTGQDRRGEDDDGGGISSSFPISGIDHRWYSDIDGGNPWLNRRTSDGIDSSNRRGERRLRTPGSVGIRISSSRGFVGVSCSGGKPTTRRRGMSRGGTRTGWIRSGLPSRAKRPTRRTTAMRRSTVEMLSGSASTQQSKESRSPSRKSVESSQRRCDGQKLGGTRHDVEAPESGKRTRDRDA